MLLFGAPLHMCPYVSIDYMFDVFFIVQGIDSVIRITKTIEEVSSECHTSTSWYSNGTARTYVAHVLPAPACSADKLLLPSCQPPAFSQLVATLVAAASLHVATATATAHTDCPPCALAPAVRERDLQSLQHPNLSVLQAVVTSIDTQQRVSRTAASAASVLTGALASTVCLQQHCLWQLYLGAAAAAAAPIHTDRGGQIHSDKLSCRGTCGTGLRTDTACAHLRPMFSPVAVAAALCAPAPRCRWYTYNLGVLSHMTGCALHVEQGLRCGRWPNTRHIARPIPSHRLSSWAAEPQRMHLLVLHQVHLQLQHGCAGV